MDRHSFSALCFDFDGTLVDSYSAIAASVNHVRASSKLPPLTVEEVKCHVGRGPEYLLTHTVPGCRLDEAIARYRAHHPTIMVEKTWLLPGAGEVLQAVHERGVALALCSNKPRLYSQELLRHLGVADFFQVVLGPEDVPRPKPAPDMLTEALKRLGVSSGQALYVGDMVVDIETARAAGVRVWVVPTGSEDRQALDDAKPDRLLRDLSEILELLEWK